MSPAQLLPEQLVKPRRFELRMSLIFATLFVPIGIHAPYFPLWLENAGFSAEDIALLLSVPLFVRVVTTPLITALADRAGDRATVYIAVVAGSLIVSCGYFLPPTFAAMFAVSVVFGVLIAPQSPLADSLALSGVRRFGTDYAKLRIWGSASFLLANFAGGLILSRTGAGAVPALIALSLAAALGVAFLAPRLGRPRRASPLSLTELGQAGPSLMTPYFLCFVAAAGAISASHGYQFAFVSIYWKSIGIGDTTIGLLWAFAVLAEIVMFMLFRRVFGHVRAPIVLALAALFAMLRWTAMPLVWPAGFGVAGFFAVQSLHAFSTGLILLGVQKLIAETVPEERTGAAQGMAFFANGFAMASVTLASGPLYEAFGVNGFYAMTGTAFLGLVFVGLAWRSAPELGIRRHHE